MNAPSPVPVPPTIASWSTYRRLKPFLRPYLRPLVLVLMISLLATGMNLAQPYLSKLMIDKALLPRDMRTLLAIAATMIALSIMGYALNILSTYRYVSASAGMLFDIRAALLRHLQTLSPRFYGSFRLGDLMSRLNSDVSDIQRVTADTLLSVLSNVMMLFGSVGIMLWLDWKLFLVAIVLVPACVFTFRHYQARLDALTREMRERGADLGSLLVDSVMGMRVIASLHAGEHEVERFRTRNNAFVRAMLRMQTASFMAGAIPGTLLTTTTSAVIIYGGWRIIEGTMTIGTLVAFMTYQSRLFSPIQVMMGLVSGLSSARVSLARIFELFDTAPEVVERADPLPLRPLREQLRLRNVSIAHAGRPVLKELDLTIPHGSFCAVVGPSGVGKSTLADLLVRYLDPDAGQVTIDGLDLRDIRIAELREAVILVDQSPFLFNDTIAVNVAFARPEASADEIARAVQLAGLGPLLARLPDGLEARTGERGLALSAGERHRVAIARALLRQPQVLILDEPTAALDEETEREVAQALRKALPEATIIAITHRALLAEMADMVVTIEDGPARVARKEALADA